MYKEKCYGYSGKLRPAIFSFRQQHHLSSAIVLNGYRIIPVSFVIQFGFVKLCYALILLFWIALTTTYPHHSANSANIYVSLSSFYQDISQEMVTFQCTQQIKGLYTMPDFILKMRFLNIYNQRIKVELRLRGLM